MEALNKWIYTIVVVMVFTTFIEILMPSSSLKKYIKVILGLLVMTIILNPILNLVNNDYTLSGYSFKFQNQIDSISLKKQSTNYSQKQSDVVTSVYKNNLENQIKQQLIKDNNVKNIDVDVDINSDTKSEDYGHINKITLYISSVISPVDKVDKVTISDKKNLKVSKKDADLYEGLKNKVSALYNLSKDKIEIKINQSNIKGEE